MGFSNRFFHPFERMPLTQTTFQNVSPEPMTRTGRWWCCLASLLRLWLRAWPISWIDACTNATAMSSLESWTNFVFRTDVFFSTKTEKSNGETWLNPTWWVHGSSNPTYSANMFESEQLGWKIRPRWRTYRTWQALRAAQISVELKLFISRFPATKKENMTVSLHGLFLSHNFRVDWCGGRTTQALTFKLKSIRGWRGILRCWPMWVCLKVGRANTKLLTSRWKIGSWLKNPHYALTYSSHDKWLWVASSHDSWLLTNKIFLSKEYTVFSCIFYIL